ncbi:MAG: helix-turn-helix transcriptional regulator, partial [Candidatus Bathyarchaeia archaeon]
NDDERKIVETLVAEGGTMLQKDIRWKTGLSRVKTHRVLFRLAKRGIVTVEKYYNTNKITLADWLRRESASATRP